jgi:hypothetical protein
MISIGIDTSQGLVYESSCRYNGRLLWPAPVISHAKIIHADEQEFKAKSSQDSFGYIFREDSFDPITKIRRGRFYESQASLTQGWQVLPHHAKPYRENYNSGVPHKEQLDTYSSHMSIWHRHIQGKQQKPLVLLGLGDCYTVWEIISIEDIYTGETMVTLKARNSLGNLPQLLNNNIPENYRDKLIEAVQTFSDEAYRASPSSVIDRARDVATCALNAYLGYSGKSAKDLGKLVAEVNSRDRAIAASTANIIARLHARGKPVEQEKRELLPIRENDANLVVQCVGGLLCELGYGEW